MIEKLKKRLSNKHFLIASFFLPLAVFFLLSPLFYAKFFIFIGVAVLVLGTYFFVLRRKLGQKEAYVQLQIQNYYEKINLVEDDIRKNAQAITSFRKKIVDYLQLKNLTEKLNSCLYLEDVSKILSSETNKLFGDGDTTIILYLFHSKTGDLGISSSHKGQMRVNIKSKNGDIFDKWIVKTMQPLLVEDTKSDYRFDIDKIETEDARPIGSLMSVPLMVGNKALGILRVDSPQENHFVTEDLRFITTLGDLGALAIENAQLYERIEQLAITDSLTDLYLRRHLLERMPEEVSRHIRGKAQMSFLMLDLDEFKQYNDNFGHVAGDILLKTVGKILNRYFDAPGVIVSRYGGEEFAVLIPECPKKRALEMAEDIRKEIAAEDIVLRRQKTNITVSIGVATFPKDASSRDELIHSADQALYKAKKQGRNRVCAAL